MTGHAGRLIRETRESVGLTQAELGRRLGVTQSAVARLEAPGANPRVETLARALRAMGSDLELSASPRGDVDLLQIDRQLSLTPAERLRRHEVTRRKLAGFVRGSRHVGVG